MLNSKNFNDILSSTPVQVTTLLNNKMTSSAISFNDIDKFPKKNGMYFVFLGDTVLYIGIAKKQTLKTRCKQYIGVTDTGATLAKKIESVRSCNRANAISYIKQSLSAKFIDDIAIDKLEFIEQVAIWAYQPKLNFVKTNTSFFNKICYP